jgi:hypothetical protein
MLLHTYILMIHYTYSTFTGKMLSITSDSIPVFNFPLAAKYICSTGIKVFNMKEGPKHTGTLNLSSGNQNVHVINVQLIFYSLFAAICLLCCILLYYIIFVYPEIICIGHINTISLHPLVYVNTGTYSDITCYKSHWVIDLLIIS